MRINTNVAALNSYNQLKNTQNNLSKSLERLSSGKRINGASDDAAGLAISEKMGSQTRGLAQAQRNAQDGISMIQTAEGALKESHSILQRMRELSVQSSNDTNTSADRAEIQKEVDQLASELTRIGETTEFNTQKLLDGTLDDTKFQIGANEGQNMEIAINDMRANSLNTAGDVNEFEDLYDSTATSVDNTGLEARGLNEDTTIQITDSAGNVTGDEVYVSVTDEAITVEADITNETITQQDIVDAVNSHSEASELIELKTSSGDTDAVANANAVELAFPASNGELETGDYTYNATDPAALGSGGELVDSSSGEVVAISTDGINFTNEGEAVFTAGDVLTDGQEFSVGGIDVSSQEAASNAIGTLDASIANVSAERSKLGAVQNRLDHTINNLNTAEENLTAAESRISDVDMAKEMMNMSKQQILSQAGTAMMAQANQLPQGVLQLLG